MNFNSLITKIVFVFIISILLFIMVFIGNYYFEENQLNKRLNNNYTKITKHTHQNRLTPREIIDYIEKVNFEFIENEEEILRKTKTIGSGPGFEILKYQDNFYLLIHGPGFRVLAKDLDKYSLNYYGFIVLGIIFIIFILSFLWIIKALKPLRLLKEEIQDFSNGKLDINCKSDKKDEIAEVANEFDNAVKKISLLLNSRQLFLRTVMHELKTPIAKGRIVSELIDNDKQKDRMISIFDKLNLLINDFSKIEEIVSKNYNINKYKTNLNLTIEKAIDMMMLDNPKNKIEYENISKKALKVDLELFALAIKNLLDNGVKYSDDKKVKIEEKENKLYISSKGKKLEKPLEDYFQAYHNETQDKNHGMGLGLYIVHEILKIHNMTLTYEYQEDNNIFKIEF
ncbi:HAMP domain-containing histidine kinase [Poseidonibacter lekithochrous]|uniref:ArsS family sensor histidine kinase n=1 Tax=Poseidonibacter TaxID=2321187 RepID=UPI001C0972ED|nr:MULTISPECIES: ArsS family sensor histidine kinase [Poseidonibacter]MBU3013883.1 HAMP domain-containing histidine kinase [Poseidonibacter lekithochrous]MDO6827177.1 ArsS family sensor histidine kinase [Poseidonibacter sp. 1_MG-2023]